jgi:hypothetical protein
LRDLTISPDVSNRRPRLPSSSPSPALEPVSGRSSDLSEPPDDSQEDTRCPYCHEPVDGYLLRSFTTATAAGGRLNLRQQRAFCAKHKKHKARLFWEERGYPAVDWVGLRSRLAPHAEHLERVLRGQAPSYFCDLLATEVKAGTRRNLLKADYNTSVGYFGSRGFRIMQEDLMLRFSKLLRERAVEDKVISGRSYSLYIQAVLVPELATRLVMEDLGLEDEEAARQVLEESAWVGDMLCEDVGDVVKSDDETEGF